MDKELLTFEDVAKRLGVGRRVAERIWNSKDFPKLKRRKNERYLIKKSAFEEWLANQ